MSATKVFPYKGVFHEHTQYENTQYFEKGVNLGFLCSLTLSKCSPLHRRKKMW